MVLTVLCGTFLSAKYSICHPEFKISTVQSYRSFLNAIDEGFCIIEMIFDEDGKPVDYRFVEVNPAFEAHTGLTDVVGKKVKDLIPGMDEHWFKTYGDVVLTGQPIRFSDYSERMQRHFSIYAYPLGEPRNREVAVLFKDITKEKTAHEALLITEARFRNTLDNMIEGCAILDFNWEYIYVNDSYAGYVRNIPENIVGKKIWEVVPGVRDSSFYADHKISMDERIVRKIEDNFVFPDGSEGWFEAIAYPVPEGIFLLVMEITERINVEKQLRKVLHEKETALKEKEVLLREVHHRTKNNMQVISSLLNMKGHKISEGETRNVLFEMKSRIQAMALVYDMLYQTDNLASLNLGSYIEKLVNLLIVSHSEIAARINVSVEAGSFDTSMDIAIPCGIIITELVVNVFRHAFPGDKKGCLNICLSNDQDNLIKLIISDDGIGIKDSEIYKEDKLGTELVKNLVEDQLNGEIKVETSSEGSCWTIIFEK